MVFYVIKFTDAYIKILDLHKILLQMFNLVWKTAKLTENKQNYHEK